MKIAHLQLIIAAAGLYLAYKAYHDGKEAAASVANAINPLNNDNVFSQGADGIVDALTDTQDQTLGGWWYDLWNPEFQSYDPNDPTHPYNQ